MGLRYLFTIGNSYRTSLEHRSRSEARWRNIKQTYSEPFRCVTVFIQVDINKKTLILIRGRPVVIIINLQLYIYVVGSKRFRPDQLFNVTEIKQLCCFST